MKNQNIVSIISKILKKKISGNPKQKLPEIENIDSLDYVKIILGLKKKGIKISISNIEKLTIEELGKKINS